MKVFLSGLVAFALLALAAPTIQAAEKSSDTKTPKAGESFSRSGTVIKNNVDICMVTGLRWALHPRKWRGREDLPEDQTCDRRARPGREK